jgi:uncharacterized membrane protein
MVGSLANDLPIFRDWNLLFNMHRNLKEMSPNVLLPEKSRVSSIDVARGIIMVIMALDHVRDFFHTDALAFDPTDLEKTNGALFFTRWITHFCAPAFIMLSGLSMRITLERKTKKELSLFLLTRGLWLMLLEVTVLRFTMFFNLYYDITLLTILWVIGLSMVLMSVLVFLEDKWLLVLALLILLVVSPLNLPLHFLTSVGVKAISATASVINPYPVIPWLGIMLLGYLLGRFYNKQFDVSKRKRTLLITGLCLLALFLILRVLNNYGESSFWTTQPALAFTIISFLNVTKYPVSLLYTLMTLGPVLMLLSVLESKALISFQAFRVFGRTPLFYFLLHFLIIHVAALILYMYKTGKILSEMDFHFAKSLGGITPEGGFSLLGVYIAWIVIVAFLYPICKGYDRYKSSHTHWWLSYL